MPQYSINICLNEFQNLSSLSNVLLKEYGSDACWFSWTILNNIQQTFQSNLFNCTNADNTLQPIRDTITCSFSDEVEFKNLLFSSPLRFFLCTKENILGVFALQIPDDFLNASTVAKWVDMECVSLSADKFKNIRAFISVKITSHVEKIQEQGTPAKIDDHIDKMHKDEANDLHEVKDQFKETYENEEFEKDDDTEEVDVDENKVLRHFRINVAVKSIGGLKRPAHITTQLVYPHLGATSPVRTPPLWVLANSESRIDGAVASYECCMNRETLSNTLSERPLNISIITKSHLGSDIIGNVHIDLTTTHEMSPHSYRCLTTGRQFKTRSEYAKHRQTMLTLLHLGRVNRAPPKDPVSIRACDSYYNIIPVSDNKRGNTWRLSSTVDGAKLRVVTIVEEIGLVGPESEVNVRPGYKMHNGGLYNVNVLPHPMDDVNQTLDAIANLNSAEQDKMRDEQHDPNDDPISKHNVTSAPAEREQLEKLKHDWEVWRQSVETQWRAAMQEKEIELRRKLELEAAAQLADRAELLEKVHDEAGKLELRLRGAIDAVERQKAQLVLKDEQLQLRAAQKTAEVQLLQRRIREEAKSLVETESRRVQHLQRQLEGMEEALHICEKRAKDSEKEFEQYRMKSRNTPESVLREEVARLKAQLAETRSEIERERRIRAEVELEKEHFRAQMNRLAVALKREREKSSGIARQELEQLRLEFLAREERYVLDGDRDELRRIKQELATVSQSAALLIRNASIERVPIMNENKDGYYSSKASTIVRHETIDEDKCIIQNLKSQLHELLESGYYTTNDEYEEDALISELKQRIIDAETRYIQKIK